MRYLNHYKKSFSYPSQSLSYDVLYPKKKKLYDSHNLNNMLSDCFLINTGTSDGYYLGNVLNGNYFKLGNESPQLANLTSALKRHSMAVKIFPRSERIYLSGGLVMGMPISTVAELDLNTMKIFIRIIYL